MEKDIQTKNQKHGYQQWYGWDNKLWFKGVFKNGGKIAYCEINLNGTKCIGEEGTEIIFYIR